MASAPLSRPSNALHDRSIPATDHNGFDRRTRHSTSSQPKIRPLLGNWLAARHIILHLLRFCGTTHQYHLCRDSFGDAAQQIHSIGPGSIHYHNNHCGCPDAVSAQRGCVELGRQDRVFLAGRMYHLLHVFVFLLAGDQRSDDSRNGLSVREESLGSKFCKDSCQFRGCNHWGGGKRRTSLARCWKWRIYRSIGLTECAVEAPASEPGGELPGEEVSRQSFAARCICYVVSCSQSVGANSPSPVHNSASELCVVVLATMKKSSSTPFQSICPGPW